MYQQLLSRDQKQKEASEERVRLVCASHRLRKHEFSRKGRGPKLVTSDYPFVIEHFAGAVTYCAAGFVDKNSDEPISGLQRCQEALSKSQLSLLQTLFPAGSAVAAGAGEKSRDKPTVASRYQEEMETLIDSMRYSSHAMKQKGKQDVGRHYIRCIKSSEEQLADTFDAMFVCDQASARARTPIEVNPWDSASVAGPTDAATT